MKTKEVPNPNQKMSNISVKDFLLSTSDFENTNDQRWCSVLFCEGFLYRPYKKFKKMYVIDTAAEITGEGI